MQALVYAGGFISGFTGGFLLRGFAGGFFDGVKMEKITRHGTLF